MNWHNDFNEAVDDIGDKGIAYAELKARSYEMQELKGSILASIITSYGEVPVSRAEIKARASEEYQTHIKGTAEAIRQELIAKAYSEKAKAHFEGLRSLISLEKKTIEKFE